MEFLIGIAGPDYVLVGSDSICANSIVVINHNKNKLHTLSTHHLMASVGESGETDRFRERLLAESSLATLRLGRSWTTLETANFSRSLVADALRTRGPYQAHILIAGVDEADLETSRLSGKTHQITTVQHKIISPIASLYWMDYLGALLKLPFAVHGYGGYFIWGLLDAKYKSDMTLEEAISLIGEVVHELQTRFIVQIPKLHMVVINKDGVKEISIDWTSFVASKTRPRTLEWKIIENNPVSLESMEIAA